MGSFRTFLSEADSDLDLIKAALGDLNDGEIDEFGWIIYNEFFDTDNEDDDSAISDFPYFDLETVLGMVLELGPDMYPYILDMLDDTTGLDPEDDDVTGDDPTNEAVSRIMKVANMNRKKRKFMKANTFADLRRKRAELNKENRINRAKRRRYQHANKQKIKAYQASRAAAIKKGKHIVKLRRKSGTAG